MHAPTATDCRRCFRCGRHAGGGGGGCIRGRLLDLRGGGCTHRPDEFVSIALWSFVLYLVTVVSILFMAVFVFKLQSESVYVLVLYRNKLQRLAKSHLSDRSVCHWLLLDW